MAAAVDSGVAERREADGVNPPIEHDWNAELEALLESRGARSAVGSGEPIEPPATKGFSVTNASLITQSWIRALQFGS